MRGFKPLLTRGLPIQVSCMETNTQRLLHTFAALADLGQEIADTGDFEEMLRNSFHLLLGSLAIRRGAVGEYDKEGSLLTLVAARGLGDSQDPVLPLASEHARHLAALGSSLSLDKSKAEAARFLEDHQDAFTTLEIDLLLPLVVRERLIGVVLLGEKATGEAFTEEDLEVVIALARHIGVGIHSHRLLEEVEHKADENQRLYDGLRTIYKETVHAFAAATFANNLREDRQRNFLRRNGADVQTDRRAHFL